MKIRLSDDEFQKFLAAPKVTLGPFKYAVKQNQAFQGSTVAVRCSEFPDINLSMYSTFHSSLNPRKINIGLLANNDPILRLDVNPGGIHTNPLSGETFFGKDTHWHIYPNMEEAIADDSNLTHKQWVYKFCQKANIEITGGYTAPKFEAEVSQFTLLGGEYE